MDDKLVLRIACSVIPCPPHCALHSFAVYPTGAAKGESQRQPHCPVDNRQREKHTSEKYRSPHTPYRSALPNTPITRTSLTLASTLESVDRVEQEAEGFARRFGFDDDDVSNIAMAVREAAVNAVIHGNSYQRDKEVHVGFEATDADLIFRISDQGSGFDADNIPDPLSPENILRGSGRGVFLMRAFMDEVHFRQLSPGTELTLIKHRTNGQGTT